MPVTIHPFQNSSLAAMFMGPNELIGPWETWMKFQISNSQACVWVIDVWCVSCKIILRWIAPTLIQDESTLVLVMAWCRQAASHCLSQCWPRLMSPFGVTRPQCVDVTLIMMCTVIMIVIMVSLLHYLISCTNLTKGHIQFIYHILDIASYLIHCKCAYVHTCVETTFFSL